MNTIVQDLQYGVRALRRSPGFSLVAVAILSLGIGLSVWVFSLATSLLFPPLPWPEADRLVRLFEVNTERGHQRVPLSYPNFHDWREENDSFEALAAFSEGAFNLAGAERPEHVRGTRTSATLPLVLRSAALHGRWFREEEDRPGAGAVVVLSNGLWTNLFEADPGVVGSVIQLDGRPHEIIGVMPNAFDFPTRTQLWVPLAQHPEHDRAHHWLQVVGRLRDGVAREAAAAELNLITERLAAAHPGSNAGWSAQISSFRMGELGRDAGKVIALLVGAVGFVLLIACANLTNLLLARGATRSAEIAIRGAIGASRGRIVRQLLTESLLLAGCGALLGVVVAGWGLGAFRAAAPPPPFQWDPSLDARAVAFTVFVAALVAAAMGIVPALRASRVGLQQRLRASTPTSASGLERGRLRSALVLGQVALSLVLLVGAALLTRSVVLLQQVPLGFQPHGVLVASLSLSGSEFDAARRIGFWNGLIEQVRTVPGVESAAAVSAVPLGGSGSGAAFRPEGYESSTGEPPTTQIVGIAGDPVGALGIQLVRGRAPTVAELADPAARLALVGSTTASRYWPGQDPIGKRIWLGGDSIAFTVVGVVGDLQLRSASDTNADQTYLPYASWTPPQMTLLVRTAGDPAGLGPAIRQAVAAVDPAIPLYDVQTLAELAGRSLWQERLFSKVFASFAIVALCFAMIGIYGLVAFLVATRTREIGIRMALGASTAGVLRLVLGQGIRLTTAGLVIGSLGAWVVTRGLTGLLFGIEPANLPTFLVSALCLASAALLASYLPARRAARVDPMIALRAE